MIIWIQRRFSIVVGAEKTRITISLALISPYNLNYPRVTFAVDAWQAISSYNQRNLVENTIFRHKTIFGGKLKARNTENQKIEFTIKCSLLNKMNSLGTADAYKVRCN